MSPLEKKVYVYIQKIEEEPNSIRKKINIEICALELNLSREILNNTISILIKDGYLKEISSEKIGSKTIGKDSTGNTVYIYKSENYTITVMINI